MKTPKPLEKLRASGLQLGIKSSFSKPKQTLALSLLIWESLDCTSEPIRYMQDDEADASVQRLPETLKLRISEFVQQNGIMEGAADTLDGNWLLSAQYELIAMGLQYVWKLAQVAFCDSSKTASCERTGGKRYAKTLSFSKNAYVLHVAMSTEKRDYVKTLMAWLGTPGIEAPQSTDQKLRRLLTVFAEDTIFRIRTESPYQYSMSGIYDVLADGEEAVQYLAGADGNYEEKVGPTRVLGAMLDSGLHPFLRSVSRSAVGLTSDITVDELKNYAELLRTSRNLDAIQQGCNESYTPIQKNGATTDAESAQNVLLYGVPGCGKSYKIKSKYCDDVAYMERVVFHPDYTYSDFVGQLLPKGNGGNVEYEFEPGPFTRILQKAVNDAQHPYYLVIEEINRGNAPAIFGDVFQLLDRVQAKDLPHHPDWQVGESIYGVNQPDVAIKVYGAANHPVKLPSNLYILATMNTADQNVFTLDTAFKRRWKMKSVKTDWSQCSLADSSIGGTGVTWRAFVETINELIVNESVNSVGSEDKRLGPFFVSEEDDLRAENFAEKVLMYLWTDAFKYARERIFKPEYKTFEQLSEAFVNVGFGVFSGDVSFPLVANVDATLHDAASPVS